MTDEKNTEFLVEGLNGYLKDQMLYAKTNLCVAFDLVDKPRSDKSDPLAISVSLIDSGCEWVVGKTNLRSILEVAMDAYEEDGSCMEGLQQIARALRSLADEITQTVEPS